MTTQRIPAEVFPLRDYLTEELDARGLSLAEFAQRIGWALPYLEPILDGERPLSVALAETFASHLGGSGVLWANLAMTYRRYRRTAGGGEVG